ncbi:hypothetical protein B484DRAFT_458959 [Ochromonadaceae sp. CCMP2298]|nr:hypothetical protein B484DRAFT_458959 [Ochromonadaceae sp. CCMP2298]
MSNADLCALAKHCPNLHSLNINSHNTDITEKSVVYMAIKCTKLTALALYLKQGRALTDVAVFAIAANLVNLRELELGHLQIMNPHTLRCIAHQCPLKLLSLLESNVMESELVYLAQHAELEMLSLGLQRWSINIEHHTYLDEQALLGGDVEALAAAQLVWAQSMMRYLPTGEGSLERLRAARNSLKVVRMAGRLQCDLNPIRGSRSELFLVDYNG